MKNFKKFLSILLSFVIVISIGCISVSSVQASETITSFNGTFDKSNRSHYYDFTASRNVTAEIDIYSNVSFKVTIRNKNTYNYVLEQSDIQNLSKTLTLTKGEYELYIYSQADYKDENVYNYSGTVEDVTVYSNSITFSKSTLTASVNDSFYLTPTFFPAGSVQKKVTYKSSNNKIATVDENGYVEALALGKCVITATLDNGKSAKCTLYVNSDVMYVFKDSSRTTPKVNNKKVKWKSNKKSLAKVNSNKIKGVKQGITKLTVKVSKKTYTCRLVVVDYKKLYKEGVQLYKDNLKDPDSLKIYHIYRGYDFLSGRACIMLDCGAKNSYGGMVRSHCYIYDNYYHGYTFTSFKDYDNDYSSHEFYLKNQKKIK